MSDMDVSATQPPAEDNNLPQDAPAADAPAAAEDSQQPAAAEEAAPSAPPKTLDEVVAKFIAFDPRNKSVIRLEDFNKLSAALELSGDSISPDTHFASGKITFAEVCKIAGVTLAELPVSINVVLEAFRKTEGAPESVPFPSFAKNLSYFVSLNVNLEDSYVSLQQALEKISGPRTEYKLNIFKDCIRRFSKDGDGMLRQDELALTARYLELELSTDMDQVTLADVMVLVNPQHKAFELGVDMNEVRKSFDWCDVDHSGTLNSNELAKALRLAGQNPSQAEFKRLKAKFDEDGNGVFDFHEFTNVVCDWYVPKDLMRQKAMEAFAVFDTDNSGTISTTELRRIMTTYGEDMSEEEVDELFKTFDTNSDGKLNISEFVSLLLS